jgi:hypothetical protein
VKFFQQLFGIKYNHLYEILATTTRYDALKKEFIPNTAAMGIRVVKNNIIKISPYSTSQTYNNLKDNGVAIINLVDNVYLYALAALKEPDSPIGLNKFPKKKYDYLKISNIENLDNKFPKNTFEAINDIPFIKSASGILICMVINEENKIKKDKLGESNLTEFQLKSFFHKKFRDSVKLFNRAENLALECIIIATRLKIAYEKNDHELCSEFQNQILNYKADLARFSENENANEAIKLVDSYIERYM